MCEPSIMRVGYLAYYILYSVQCTHVQARMGLFCGCSPVNASQGNFSLYSPWGATLRRVQDPIPRSQIGSRYLFESSVFPSVVRHIQQVYLVYLSFLLGSTGLLYTRVHLLSTTSLFPVVSYSCVSTWIPCLGVPHIPAWKYQLPCIWAWAFFALHCKNVNDFPVPSRDVTNETLTDRD